MTKLTDETMDKLLNSIYQAAVDQSNWHSCLALIASLIDACSGMLGVDDVENGLHLSRVNYGYDPAMVERLTHGDLRGKDVWAKALIQRSCDGFLLDEELLARRQFLKSDIFNNLLNEFDICHTIGAYLDRHQGLGIRMAFQRTSKQGSYSEKERDFLDRLRPHIRHSVQLNQGLLTRPDPSFGLGEQFRNNADALFLVTSAGRVVYSNQTAERLISQRDGLDIRSGILCIHELKPNEWAGALESVCRTERLASMKSAYEFYVRHEPNKLKLITVNRYQVSEKATFVVPFIHHQTIHHQTLALVRLSDVRLTFDNEQVLGDLFGLTSQELGVSLNLINGLAPKEIADQTCRSINTIRTQIKTIYAKTNVRNAAELISLFNSILRTSSVVA